MEKVRLIIAEDDARLREHLIDILRGEETLDLLGCAVDGEQALQLAMQFEPQVALMDIKMPRMDGIESTRRIKHAMPSVQVVIWTVYADDQNVFEAIKAGAIGYLLKDSPPDEIVRGVHAAARGESQLDPAVAARVIHEFQRVRTEHAKASHLLTELTARELEILRMIAQGKRNKEIADALFITEKTVKNYISNILFKLQVNSRTEAALLAVRQGLV
ncbi:MAG: response regulator transcription factor [Fimbriimonadales bacterium]|nr:response regulator transcription factor [Fimbriimonadales bacterium]